jgi:hypothetical protein
VYGRVLLSYEFGGRVTACETEIAQRKPMQVSLLSLNALSVCGVNRAVNQSLHAPGINSKMWEDSSDTDLLKEQE